MKELGDPQGVAQALAALSNKGLARWTLATPVWDYRLAAAETLAALGEGSRAYALVDERLKRALEAREINDIFANVQLLVALADPRALDVFPSLRERFAAQASALQAVSHYEVQFKAALSKAVKG